MVIIRIPLDPVSWSVPRLGKGGHVYDPREADKRAIRYIIRESYKEPVIRDFVAIFFRFFFKVPPSYSKKKRKEALDGKIIPTRMDCTNCQKLYEDCLQGIVIDNDRNVEIIGSLKAYSEKSGVTIVILKTDEYIQKLLKFQEIIDSHGQNKRQEESRKSDARV